MKTTVKKLTVGKKTSTIIFQHDDAEKTRFISEEMKAIYILLGEYNEFGRDIPTHIYREMRDKLENIINEVQIYTL